MNYISFKNKDVTHVIDSMQYDTDRTAEFMVEEDIQNKNITYEINTANEKEVKGDCTISNDNVVSFLIPENVTASPGIYKGQLISRDSAGSSAQISSFPFLVSVEKAVHDQDDPYEVALSEVRQATQDCIEATEALNDVKEAAESATSAANGATSAANSAASAANSAASAANAKLEAMQELIDRFGEIDPDDLVTPTELTSAINALKTELTATINAIKNGTTDVMIEVEGS